MPNDDTDLYSDGPAEAPVEAVPESDAETTTGEGESAAETESTGLLPKDFFEGKSLEVGARCEVEIERVLDDQVQVRYIPHSQSEDSEATPPESNDPELAEMME